MLLFRQAKPIQREYSFGAPPPAAANGRMMVSDVTTRCQDCCRECLLMPDGLAQVSCIQACQRMSGGLCRC